MCVFITAVRRVEDVRTCAMRDDEPRPVWTRLPIMHWACYYCSTFYKAVHERNDVNTGEMM